MVHAKVNTFKALRIIESHSLQVKENAHSVWDLVNGIRGITYSIFTEIHIHGKKHKTFGA